MNKDADQTQEEKINKQITLRKDMFLSSKGIFAHVYAGELTEIVKRFNSRFNQNDDSNNKRVVQSQNDILQLIIERDELGRTPLDIAGYLGFKNIALYLVTKAGTPQDVIHQEINVDDQGRNVFHSILAKGNYDCLIALLNIERVYLKKTLFDQLLQEKNRYRFKNMDIKHGHLTSSVFHDADSLKRHEDFNIRVFNLFDQYTKDIVERSRQILTQQDCYRRNPIHYGAMSKYTKCYKSLEAMLSIDLDSAPANADFLHLFFQIQVLENGEESKFDPRKYKNVLAEFEHLLSPADYKRIVKEFRHQVKLLLKEVLNSQDQNYHTPLHIASYYGDFKSSRLFTKFGANAASAATAEAPLEVGKDKFARSVLQNLNDAANTANVKDLEYLVNCGENINSKASIVGQAPIHKAVLSGNNDAEKKQMLSSIFKLNADVNTIDSNGWTALHHAAYNGDLQAVDMLTAAGANINAFSNQFKTPLHFAAMNNHESIVGFLLSQKAGLELKDELECTPLHQACRKGSDACLQLLLRSGANIMALDNRSWTPLHYASYNGMSRAVNFLLKWEADYDKLRFVRNSQNRTAFIISKNQHVKKAFNHVWQACKDGDLDQVRILLREGEDPSQKTQDLQNTPMHIAAQQGHYLIVKYLIELNCNTTTTNAQGYTPRGLLMTGLLDPAKVEQLAMRQKTVAAQNKIREKQKLLGDTARLLQECESQGKGQNNRM